MPNLATSNVLCGFHSGRLDCEHQRDGSAARLQTRKPCTGHSDARMNAQVIMEPSTSLNLSTILYIEEQSKSLSLCCASLGQSSTMAKAQCQAGSTSCSRMESSQVENAALADLLDEATVIRAIIGICHIMSAVHSTIRSSGTRYRFPFMSRNSLAVSRHCSLLYGLVK